MKKLLTLILAFVMSNCLLLAEAANPEISTMTPAALSVTPMNVCEHIFRIMNSDTPIREGWYSLNDLYHEYRKFYIGSCINEGCVADGEVCVADQIGQHIWTYSGTNFHNKNKSTHTYVHICTTCGCMNNTVFPCGGDGNGNCPPYSFPMSLNQAQ